VGAAREGARLEAFLAGCGPMKESLAEVQGDIDPLAKKYGKGDKIDQVMFAGHGAARVIELAGKVRMALSAHPPDHISSSRRARR
jgi:hypothetical protein